MIYTHTTTEDTHTTMEDKNEIRNFAKGDWDEEVYGDERVSNATMNEMRILYHAK